MKTAFDEWWMRAGQFFDPDTEDVSWYDKRRFLAEEAYRIGMAHGRNYVADKEVDPTKVTFTNGRVVKCVGGYLVMEESPMTAPDRQPAQGEASKPIHEVKPEDHALWGRLRLPVVVAPVDAIAYHREKAVESALTALRAELSAERTRREDAEKRVAGLQEQLNGPLHEIQRSWRRLRTSPSVSPYQSGERISSEKMIELIDENLKLCRAALALTEPTAAEEGKP